MYLGVAKNDKKCHTHIQRCIEIDKYAFQKARNVLKNRKIYLENKGNSDELVSNI